MSIKIRLNRYVNLSRSKDLIIIIYRIQNEITKLEPIKQVKDQPDIFCVTGTVTFHVASVNRFVLFPWVVGSNRLPACRVSINSTTKASITSSSQLFRQLQKGDPKFIQ